MNWLLTKIKIFGFALSSIRLWLKEVLVPQFLVLVVCEF